MSSKEKLDKISLGNRIKANIEGKKLIIDGNNDMGMSGWSGGISQNIVTFPFMDIRGAQIFTQQLESNNIPYQIHDDIVEVSLR